MKTPAFWNRLSLTSVALIPFSWLYRLGAAAAQSHHTPQAAPIPVISVGNVTAGGAGKTPTAIAIMALLQTLGAQGHFLTRGYKAAAPLSAHRVTDQDDGHSVGDEALLLARIAPTWVGRDRLASAKAAAQAGATLAICDDGLQHHRLKKDISLLVIDGPYGLGNGQLMPAGPLRETLANALARCDAVIMIGEDRQQLGARISLPIFQARLVPSIDPAIVVAQPWLAFAGIGRPEKFFDTLRDLDASLVATRAFPDHHAYQPSDIEQLAEEAIRLGAKLITTEKDAVKLTADQRALVTVLPVSLVFDDAEGLQNFLKMQLAAEPA